MLHPSRDVVFDEESSPYTMEPSIDMVEEARDQDSASGSRSLDTNSPNPKTSRSASRLTSRPTKQTS